jgi:hypothetical protein
MTWLLRGYKVQKLIIRRNAGSRDEVASCQGLIQCLLGFTKKKHTVVVLRVLEAGIGTLSNTTTTSRMTTKMKSVTSVMVILTWPMSRSRMRRRVRAARWNLNRKRRKRRTSFQKSKTVNTLLSISAGLKIKMRKASMQMIWTKRSDAGSGKREYVGAGLSESVDIGSESRSPAAEANIRAGAPSRSEVEVLASQVMHLFTSWE